jgi:transcriptional regulator with XRE-family HTH domain
MISEPHPAKRTPPRPTLQLGEAIRDQREARRLSMQATADRAGISAGYQFKLEGGFVRTPSPRVLHRLSAVLEVPYPELMKLAGYPDDAAPAVPSASSGDVRVDGANAGAPAPEATVREPAPTNRRIIRLLEEIRHDVAAIREDLRRLESTQRGTG